MSGRAATAAVAARLTAVATGAKVWDGLDNKVDPQEFADRFVSEEAVHAWEVTREGSDPIETESASAITRRQRVVAYGFRVERKGDTTTEIETEHPALAQLVMRTANTVNGKSVSVVPPRYLIAAGMVLRAASAEIAGGDLLSELTEVHVSATWSADESGKMSQFEGLVHRFKQPTIDQFRRYKLGAARVMSTGTAKDGATVYPSRLAVALGLYDELIAEVEGYAVAGETNLSKDQIVKFMDGYHKAITVYELFERSSDEVTIGAPESEGSGDEAADLS